MPSFLFRIVVLLLVHAGLCSSKDTLTVSTPLTDSHTLVSAGKRFELGFFNPNGSDKGERYVGIWYYRSSPKTVVWVANHENPLNDSSGSLAIREGDLNVLDGHNKSYWSPELRVPSASFLKLLDSGNLVLLQEDGSTLWQSFDNPTDTFLPGMKMDGNFKLTSWTSETDPRMGKFTFELVQDGQYIIRNGLVTYWTSGPLEDFFSSDTRFGEVSRLLSNFSADTMPSTSKSNHNFRYDNITRPNIDYDNTRLVMNFNGEIQFFKRKSWEDPWTLNWWQPRDNCGVFRYCGSFASCNSGYRTHCKCLPGFEPNSHDNLTAGYFSEGCRRKSPLCSKDVGIIHFIKLKMMGVASPSVNHEHRSESECREECQGNCNCQAYSFEAETDKPTCLIWLDDLYGIQEQYPGRDRHDLNVRVPLSDIGLTKRDCELCGIYIIQYPLSTGPNCGDPMYSSFKCDNASGQVTFEVSDHSYPVTGINYQRHEFSIQDADCSASHSVEEILQHNQSFPFDLTNGCQISSEDKWSNEVEISWKGPSEPLCSAPEDCNDWPNSSCDITGNGTRKCLCKKLFKWDPAHINCTSEELLSNANENFAKKHYPILLAVTASVIIVASAAFYLCHPQRTRAVTRRENRERIQGNIAFCLEDSERQVKDFVDSDQFEENDRKGIDVPYFDLECILAATDNFSDENKLGRGGFGPVYKGKLSGGQEIAIKRLSSGSAQGLAEFKNEVVLIAKLQHRNLVRLLGYCVAGYEKMLVYEYMPNRSLDSFIFDRTLCHLLNWEMRFAIIMGIARGLLYLHQDSRLRIIHRDLKTSNVLLDDEMNPKISDFGLARIVGGKQTEAQTVRVVGTYGYMSPEYALDGLFSTKSDVFSFGVVVLEILSGKRNTGFYNFERGLSLLAYAWRLWKEEKILSLMDQALRETCNPNEFLRCVNVGLLCVQEDPGDRPTMSNVVFMLGSETATLPSPKEPAFVERRSRSVTGSSSSKLDSNNELTISLEKGR